MGKPTINPADGAKIIAIPPRPPAIIGKPVAIMAINNITANAPLLAPKILPANIGPKDWAVIGIGWQPRNIGGIAAKALHIAANNAMYTMFCIDIILGYLLIDGIDFSDPLKGTYQIDNKISYTPNQKISRQSGGTLNCI